MLIQENIGVTQAKNITIVTGGTRGIGSVITESFKKGGKRVLTVDLNPLSRTSKMSNITIVDNIMRAIPVMILECRKMKQLPKGWYIRIRILFFSP